MVTAKQTLKQCPVFSALSSVELEKVASQALEKEYEAGAAIFQEGDRAEELLVLEDGKVALQMTLPRTEPEISRRITVDIVTRNEVVGWSAVVEPHIYTLTAICLQKVKVLSINGTKLRRLLQDNPGTGYEVLKGLIQVVTLRLHDTRHVLVSERLPFLKPE